MTADLGDLTLGADQPATAAIVLRNGDCTAMCLVAVDAEAAHCECPCGGMYHAALRDVVVPGSRRRTRVPEPDDDALFGVDLPEPAGSTP